MISVSAHVRDLSQAVWVAHDGSAVAWVSVTTQGHAPSKRFHHTTTLFDGKLYILAEHALLQAAALLSCYQHEAFLVAT